MKKTTMYIPEALLTEIKVISKQSRCSEAETVRQALDEFVNSRRQPIPSVFGMGSEGKIHGADSEDWLKENWQPE